MTTKRMILSIACSIVAALMISCAGGDVKSTGNAIIDGLNAMLAKVPIEGYKSGQAASKEEWNKMITLAVPVVKEVLPKVPQGYALQVTGHTDGQGGVNSAGNYNLSAQRAMQVWTELRKRGVTDPKLTSKGAAGTIASSKCSINDSCQRRVTFIVVKK